MAKKKNQEYDNIETVFIVSERQENKPKFSSIKQKKTKKASFLKRGLGAIVNNQALLRKIANYTKVLEPVPEDFNPRTYYKLNPDVEAKGIGAWHHYCLYGKAEGRRFR